MCLAAEKGNRQMFKYLCELTPADTKTLGQCLVEVAKAGDWHFVNFLLLMVTDSKWISSAIEEAASMGGLDIVELLLSRGKPFKPNHPFAFVNAAALGTFDLLQILESAYNSEHENIRRSDRWRLALAVSALTGGHIEIFTWAFQTGGPTYRAELVTRAASTGELNAIQELCLFRFPVMSDALISAASSGHLDIIEYLHERRKEKCDQSLLHAAVQSGSLDVVKFVHENRPDDWCDTTAMDSSASRGYLDIVRFLHQNRTEGCTTKAMDKAAIGYFATLRFLHERRTEGCTTKATRNAAKQGCLHTLKFLPRAVRTGVQQAQWMRQLSMGVCISFAISTPVARKAVRLEPWTSPLNRVIFISSVSCMRTDTKVVPHERWMLPHCTATSRSSSIFTRTGQKDAP